MESRRQNVYPAFNYQQMIELHHTVSDLKFLFLPYMAMNDEVIAALKLHPEVVIIAQSNHPNRLGEYRAMTHELMNEGLEIRSYSSNTIRKRKLKICKSKRQLIWVH